MDEVFLTNSLIGIMKVNFIEDIEFNKEDVTNIISNKYREYLLKLEGKG